MHNKVTICFKIRNFVVNTEFVCISSNTYTKSDKKIIKILSDTDVQQTNENIVESLIVKKIQDIKMEYCILFAVYLNKKLDKEGIKKILKKWGKIYKKSWWQGGNFKKRAFDEFLVEDEGYYLVNKNGKLKIKELISELREN